MTAPDHDALRELSGLYALGALETADRSRFEAHLKDCAECAEEVRLLAPVVQGLSQAVPLREPPARLRDRVLASVGAPASETREHRRTSVSTLPAWLATAASLIGVMVLGYMTVDRQRRITELEQRLQEVTLRATSAETEIAQVRQNVNEARAHLGVLLAPDVTRVNLAGQPAAPTAEGRVYWSRSRGLLFTASNLPGLPAGKIYELWVVTAQAPVRAGLARPDQSGNVTAVFDNPGQLPGPVAAMAVTLEPEGGVPAPTGAMYLVGPLVAGL